VCTVRSTFRFFVRSISFLEGVTVAFPFHSSTVFLIKRLTVKRSFLEMECKLFIDWYCMWPKLTTVLCTSKLNGTCVSLASDLRGHHNIHEHYRLTRERYYTCACTRSRTCARGRACADIAHADSWRQTDSWRKVMLSKKGFSLRESKAHLEEEGVHMSKTSLCLLLKKYREPEVWLSESARVACACSCGMSVLVSASSACTCRLTTSLASDSRVSHEWHACTI